MKISKRSRLTLSLRGTSIVLVFFTAALNGLAQKATEPSPTPTPQTTKGFAQVPPGVEAATLQLLDSGGTALLEVTFEKDDRLGKEVSMVLGGKEQFLRDDGSGGDAKEGDGVFSAVIDFDLGTLKDQAEFAIKTGGKSEPQAIFNGREVIGVEDPQATAVRFNQLIELQNIDRLIQTRARINLFNFVPLISPATINPGNSLMITNPLVVQDPTRTINPCTGVGNPNGVWTFKHLMTEMVAGTGINPADFAEQWLLLWLSPQTPNAFTAPPRPNMFARVIAPWPRIAGKLDLDQSPFRLAAIVNRADLGSNPTYGGGGGSAGEGRLVFGVVDRTAGCTFMPFSVIFEYGIPISGCEAIKAWANQWIDLSFLAIGSPAYNAALEAITEQFVQAGAAPSKPNGSALNQLRTNENALNPLWELREFKIAPTPGFLFQDTVKLTPDEVLNTTVIFTMIADGTVPITPFLGGSARASVAQLNTHFNGPGLANSLRFPASLNTCTACHIRETSTTGVPFPNNAFLHVDPRFMPARLSRFLTGSTPSILDTPDLFNVTDPTVAVIHPFNDLDRRRQVLASLGGSSCFIRFLVPPSSLVSVLRPIGPSDPVRTISDLRLNSVNVPILSPH